MNRNNSTTTTTTTRSSTVMESLSSNDNKTYQTEAVDKGDCTKNDDENYRKWHDNEFHGHYVVLFLSLNVVLKLIVLIGLTSCILRLGVVSCALCVF